MTESKAIIKYKDAVTLSKKQAVEIITSIWPGAPQTEVAKAALICHTYGLNPLMRHLFLVPFKNKKTGEQTWAIIIARKAARIMAARKKAFSYIDDSPRIMVNGEPEKYFGENDPNKIYSITILQDESGNVARGYGFWIREDEPYGAEKGNSKANMAHLRSEGQAIDRMVPDTLPPDIDVIDERFVGDFIDADTEVLKEEPTQLQSGICPLHGVAWEKKTGKRGTWFSHKTVEGWCNKSDVDKLPKPEEPQDAKVTDPVVGDEYVNTPWVIGDGPAPVEADKVAYNRFAIQAIGFFRQLDWKEKTIETWIKNNFPSCTSLTDLKPDQWKLCLSKLGDMLALKMA